MDGNPKATLIVPCWNAARTIADSLACARAQTFKNFEAIYVDDGSDDGTVDLLHAVAKDDLRIRVLAVPHRGVSAARNAALDAARGEFIFFADADDTFSPEMLARGVEAMERDRADLCIFPYRERGGDDEWRVVPLDGEMRFSSNAEIVAGHVSRMFGYSSAQVKAWYAGASLFAGRIRGFAWCYAFRRELVERFRVRFDERIALYEDALFVCEFMLHAERMTSTAPDVPLYDYAPTPRGAMGRLHHGLPEMENKLELLRKRKELDAKSGGRVAALWECTCALTLLKMAQTVLLRRAPFVAGLKLVRRYAADETVRRSLRDFPLSFRRPALAASILLMRALFPLRGGR